MGGGALRRLRSGGPLPRLRLTSTEVIVKDMRAFWSCEPDDEGFDPVKYPEIKPYIAAPRDDDELGLRALLERPEILMTAPPPTGRRRAARSRRPRAQRRRRS